METEQLVFEGKVLFQAYVTNGIDVSHQIQQQDEAKCWLK